MDSKTFTSRNIGGKIFLQAIIKARTFENSIESQKRVHILVKEFFTQFFLCTCSKTADQTIYQPKPNHCNEIYRTSLHRIWWLYKLKIIPCQFVIYQSSIQDLRFGQRNFGPRFREFREFLILWRTLYDRNRVISRY